jgi:hypothetical protein
MIGSLPSGFDPPPGGGVQYAAFISYSHRDARWARWLHRSLETYRPPRRSRLHGAGEAPARIFPVFRDREELPSGGDLTEGIRDALSRSRALIVICSRHAARSRWIDEEVRLFRSLAGDTRIHCLIVDGHPNATAAGLPDDECFPLALRRSLVTAGTHTAVGVDPMATDARRGADGRRGAFLRIAAGLLGVSYDELRRRDLVRQRRRLLAWSLAGTVTTAVLAATTWRAVAAEGRAVAARAAAERERAIGELRFAQDLLRRGGVAQAVALLASARDHLDGEARRETDALLRAWLPQLVPLDSAVRAVLGSAWGVVNWRGAAYLAPAVGTVIRIGGAPALTWAASGDTGTIAVQVNVYELSLFDLPGGRLRHRVSLDGARLQTLSYSPLRRAFVARLEHESASAGGAYPEVLTITAGPPFTEERFEQHDLGDKAEARPATEWGPSGTPRELVYPLLRDAGTLQRTVVSPTAGRDSCQFPAHWHKVMADGRALLAALQPVAERWSARRPVRRVEDSGEAADTLDDSASGTDIIDFLPSARPRTAIRYSWCGRTYLVASADGGAQYGMYLIADSARLVREGTGLIVTFHGEFGELAFRGPLAYIRDLQYVGHAPFRLLNLATMSEFAADSVPDGSGPETPVMSSSGQTMVIGTTSADEGPEAAGDASITEHWVFSLGRTPDGEGASRRLLPRDVELPRAVCTIGDAAVVFAGEGGTLVTLSVRDGQELWRVDPPAAAERVERCAADPAGDYVALLSRDALQMLSARSGVPAGSPMPLVRTSEVRAIRDSMPDITFDGAARPIVTSANSAYAGPAPLPLPALGLLLPEALERRLPVCEGELLLLSLRDLGVQDGEEAFPLAERGVHVALRKHAVAVAQSQALHDLPAGEPLAEDHLLENTSGKERPVVADDEVALRGVREPVDVGLDALVGELAAEERDALLGHGGARGLRQPQALRADIDVQALDAAQGVELER